MINSKVENRKIIPQIVDKTEYIYVEKARIEQDNTSICIVRGNERIPVPICQLACIILGPGTTITHRAVTAIADSGCTLAWVGEGFRAYYATGYEKDRSSMNMLKQVEYYADHNKHMEVVGKMYHLRFRDIPIKGLSGLSIEQMRGMEGLRMREIYDTYAKEYDVPWNGRKYVPKNPDSQDPANYLLTIGNQWLYHICRAAISSLGYSPAVGFIHTGKMDSFVYDIADLYKTDIVIPSAFSLAKDEVFEKRSWGEKSMRIKCHDRAKEIRLIKRIVHDIAYFFDNEEVGNEFEHDGALWDNGKQVQQGVNYSDLI